MLAASYYFYMSWSAKYVVLILFTTVVSYTAAILIERQSSRVCKNIVLSLAVLLCMGVLFIFKYFNFVSESISGLLGLFSVHTEPILLKMMLPVGISFYTFQTLSYVVDVWGGVSAERNFGYYAAFVSFFPQLVAGPIERTGNLLPQIKTVHSFDNRKAEYGVKLMLWGFYKKLVVADVLSVYVSRVFDDPAQLQGFALILGAVFFSFQIYCDFSGYSDIAVGTAKLFGIDLMNNFNSPYFSVSIKEFWSRWHISLSTWFRDYVYIPLGGSRVSKARHALNLMITFFISGLWHGANWTFVVWGGIHGLGQIIENAIWPGKKREYTGVERITRAAFVFAFSTFAWIFFVSNSLRNALYVLRHMFDGITAPGQYLLSGLRTLEIGETAALKIAFSVAVLAVYDYFNLKIDCIAWITERKTAVRWGICGAVLITIFCMGYVGRSSFVYFQF